MDNRKRGNPLFSFYDKKVEDGRNGGVCDMLEGEGEEEVDLFGDEDDEIFSKISEDSVRIENIKEEEQSQPSTSAVGRPSPSAHVSSFGKVTPQSRPLEKLPDFDEEAGTTWIYPINYPLRNYQLSMVENALFKNTLISLPTGLGKTFIAAVVMYNFYRWYPTCKVVFMAPTKPLVAQQVEACFNIMGIPQEDISQMTGTLNPEKRIQQWTEKRVFFLTPQVLDNDLSRGTCPAKLIRCLVLDEAHRALGNHAYCQVVRGLREHGHDFRILALSATPGSDMPAVRQVLTNLFISHVELRNEDSADLQEYTFQRSIEKVVVPLGEELTNLSGKYLKILRMYVSRLIELQVLYTRDETSLTKFQLLKSRECFRQNPPTTLPRNKFGAVEGLFALCMTLYHAYELMMQHGIRSFYRFLKETLSNEKSHFFARSELRANGLFQSLMGELSKKFEGVSGATHSSRQDSSALFSQVGSPRDSKMTPTASFIISHPKMAKLLSIVQEHHQKFADEDKSSRIMIFSQYRDSVLEITEMLQQHHPLVKAMSFIGHNRVGSSGKGLSQKKQIEVVSKFREGGYNTLVSTCVGEEGLDIGDVDLIICYDAPKSPIRLVQRMGRTGRKREGRIVVLLTKGKEEQSYNASQYQKKAISTALGDTSKLARYLVPNSPRMVPRGLSPSCIKLHMKADSWKTNTKVCKTSPKGKGSLLSMLSKAGSSSKKSSLGALMSQEEWLWYKDIRVPWKEVKVLPPASLMCLDAFKREFDCKKHIDLGSYQPWQSLPQTTHHIGHSPHTLHLVELTEFIHLHQHFGPEEDPYGLEMAAFLDRAYVEDDDENYQLSPDFKKAPSKHTPAASQEDGKVKKVKKMQNSIGGKRKKAKIVQSSLITDMFNRMAQSQTKAKQDNNQKRNMVPSQSCSQNNAENNNMYLDNNANLPKNTNNAVDDDDDDVVCLMDDNVGVVQNPPVIRDGSQDDRGKQSARTTEASERNRLDQVPSKRSPEERQDSHKEALFLPMPSGGSLSLDIEVPPQTTDFESDEEIEEPDSPSEVLEFCNKWLAENLKTNASETEKNNAVPHSRDMFEFTMTEKVPGAKKVGGNNHVMNNANNFVGNDDCEQLQGNTSVFSIGEVSPVIGKSLCTKSKIIGRTDGNDDIFGSPRGSKDVTGLTSMDVSPVLGRNNTLQSSTPKTISKSLFKGNTPRLSTIEEFSPIPRNQHDTGAPDNLRSPVTATGKRKRDNECQKNVGSHSDSQQSHRKRFKSKLSRFARPEEPEVEFIAEISSVENAEGACDSAPTKGYGKIFPKKLLYEKIPAKSDQSEVLTNKLSSELNIVTGLTSSFSKTAEYKDISNFLFEDLNKINACKDNESLKFVERRQQDDLNVNHSNILNSVKDSSQPSYKPQGEDNLGSRKETTSAQSGEQNQQSVCKGAKAESTKDSKVIYEATNGNASHTMEDCSLFAHIDECQLDPCQTMAAEKHEDSSSGLTITQVLHFMNEKFTHEAQNASNSTILKPLSNNSKNTTGNLIQATGHPSRKLSLSLNRKNHQDSKPNKSDECVDIEVPNTPSTTVIGGSQRKFPSKTMLNLLGKSDLSPNQTTEPRDADEGPKEKHVSFCNQENEEFDMSESLLADVDFELVDMPEINDVQTGSAAHVKNSSSTHPSLAEDCVHGNRLHEGSKDQSSTRPLSRSKQDSGNESSKLMSPTQETQFLIRRKRKVYNVVGSDQEDSLVSSDTDKDASKTTTISDNSRASTENACVTAPLRKAVADHLKSEFDDDDLDFVEVLGPHQPKEKPAKQKSKKKKKRLEYLDDEAELSMDARFVSSDESEDEERDYDHSFVDDGTYLSQDNEQDMKAIYLRSVASPIKPSVNLHHRPPLKYIHDSEDSEAEEDEDLGSFVVDNSFVEYETEYVGETMLAEDPIIQQALQNQGKTKKTKDANNGNKAKRKRIVVNESSSDEDTGAASRILKQTPVKNICMEKPQPFHQDKNLHAKSHGKNVGVGVNNKNASSCSKVNPNDSEDFEVAKIKPLLPKPQDQPKKLSCGKLSLNFNRERKFPANTVRSQTLNSQEMSDSSFVKPITTKNITFVNDRQLPQGLGRGGGKQGMGANGGVTSTLLSPVLQKSSVPPKDDSRKDHDEGLDSSLTADTLTSPTTSPVGGCLSTSSMSPQLNTSNSFFVASLPCNRSLANSQTVGDSAPQESVGVLVDSSEVQNGGNLVSRLRLHYGAQTAVVSLKHAHYAVSTRMAVARLSLSVFSSSQYRSRLVERVQGMLEMYERPVIIVETEAARGSSMPHQALGRSRYLDTIVCACTQVTRLKLLYSKSQEETSHMLWQLLLQEKTKGFKISTEPPMNKKRQQMVTFYLTLPSIGYPTAVALAQNFSTIKEFINSSPECIMKTGSISIQKATALKQHITRQFREDFLVT